MKVMISQPMAGKNDADVEAKAQIAEKNNELAIKQAELKIISDTKSLIISFELII